MPEHPPSFTTLAAGPSPAPGEILLAIATELEPCDPVLVDERLDELGRALFGSAQLELRDQVDRLGAVLESPAGLGARGDAVEHLLLPRVLADGCGHPLLLAAIAAEAGGRAGMCTAVLSSPTGWYAGVWVPGDSTIALLRLSPGLEPPPPLPGTRTHGGHEVAYAVLDGLERRLAARKDPRAEQARGLRRTLPPTRSLPEAVGRAELRARTR